MKPLLQVALDVTDGKKALELAHAASKFVDIIEVGTPLIKAEGLKIVTMLKELFPQKLILADMKIADTGDLEARMAFTAGAQIVTVLGCVSLSTVQSAIAETRAQKGKIVVDLIGVADTISKAKEIMTLKPDYLGVHTAIDEQLKGRSPFEEAVSLAKFGFPLSVAGGITLETIDRLAPIPIKIIVVGGAITKAKNPKKIAQALKEKIDRLWKG
jgi:3-hexulose-6-phosphate synthase